MPFVSWYHLYLLPVFVTENISDEDFSFRKKRRRGRQHNLPDKPTDFQVFIIISIGCWCCAVEESRTTRSSRFTIHIFDTNRYTLAFKK